MGFMVSRPPKWYERAAIGTPDPLGKTIGGKLEHKKQFWPEEDKPPVYETPEPAPLLEQTAGQANRSRLRGRAGRGSTILTGRALRPATARQRELGTTMG